MAPVARDVVPFATSGVHGVTLFRVDVVGLAFRPVSEVQGALVSPAPACKQRILNTSLCLEKKEQWGR